MPVDRRLIKNIDGPLVLITIGLIAFGLVAAYSATFQAVPEDPYFFVKRQLIGVVVGAILSFAVLQTDYNEWKRYVKFLYGLTIAILIAVLFIAPTVSGAGRWIVLGPLQIQPSELAKLTLIIALARFLSDHQREHPSFLIKGSLMYLAAPTILILLQPDLGTALVFVGIAFGMWFIAGIPVKSLLIMAASGVVAFVLAAFVSVKGWVPIFKPYQIQRLTIFFNPYSDPTGDGWNVIQSMIAIGSGGFFGKGFSAGTQTQLRFIPARHTDFIFAVIGEEAGFLGGFLLLLGFCLLFLRSIRLMTEAKDQFGVLLITGIISMMLMHVVINVGMTMGIMPITGLPLPFTSVGGSSLMASMVGVAVILNVHMRRHKILF